MNKFVFFLAFVFGFLSCSRTEQFSISGVVDAAPKGSVVYFEYMGLQSVEMLDSVILGSDGKFVFEAERPLYPDLYRLRMGGANLVCAVDSTEQIVLRTSADSFAFPTLVEGSYKTEELTQLRESLIALQRAYKSFNAKEVTADEFSDQIARHKKIACDLILENPRSIVAYYALYQTVGGFFVFTPADKADRPYFSAVATSFHNFMPQYDRSKGIYTLTMNAINEERRAKNAAILQEMVKNSDMGLIDIELENQFGNVRKLSDLKGQVVLLDFSVYESERQTEYVFMLRELYNKYARRGFEIFQVSFDRNKLLWQQLTENLPWVCVRDANGDRSEYLYSYNIQSLPTMFLIDKTGTIVGRDIALDKLPGEIEQCLRGK